MCEQTEINYLDGDIVWVKLGSYWWPGQVVGLEKLPDDIQVEFQKKPLIAAVKFFNESSFEFVKNYQQIYKYNCTQKEDFVRKGLDKYRAKSKDGSNYMDKFPEDVKTAEILTGGDPDILTSEKFCPEEKPDISGLFGEKKIPKKKRNRDDSMKKNDNDVRRRVTHPRFLRENDHEIRIRQQPKNQPSTSNISSPGGIFPCHICGFTATRVNVIICHLKNHRLNNETATIFKSKTKTNVQPKLKQINFDTPKRKYVRKLVPGKSKTESEVESGKRKHLNKQIEKPNKKKKSDDKLREKLLADWNVDSDDDEPIDFDKSVDSSFVDLSSKNESSIEIMDDTDTPKDKSNKDESNVSSIDVLQESDKLLKETDSFAKLSILKDMTSTFEDVESDENDSGKPDYVSLPTKGRESFHFKKVTVEKSLLKEKDDKKSRLSCFDFDEDDVPEPSISSVRKIPRSLGSKTMSIKKEIIKEFEMSQALKSEVQKDLKNDEISKSDGSASSQIVIHKEKEQIAQCCEDKVVENEKNENSDQSKAEKFEKNVEICETQVEIVEIFEVEKEDEKNFSKLKVENESKTETMEKEKSIKAEAVKEEFAESEVVNDDVCGVEVQLTKTDKKSKDNEDQELQKEVGIEVEKTEIEQNEIIVHKFTEENKSKEINENKCNISIERELNNVDSSNFIKRDFSTSNVSTFDAKEILHTPENQETFFDALTAKVQDKTALSVESVFETQSNSDNEVLTSFKHTSQEILKDEDKTTKSDDNLNDTTKKRRGRPRKSLTSTEEIVNDTELLKPDYLHKKLEIIESDRKTSESDSDRSYSGRKRKPNRKYQSSLYLQSFDHLSSKTDESLSESDDKPEKIKSKIKRSRKPTSSKSNAESINTVQSLESTSNHLDDKSNVEAELENYFKNDSVVQEFMKEQDDISTGEASNQSDCNNLKEQKDLVGAKEVEIQQNNDRELLPPKKSQIKKFELLQMDSSGSDITNSLNLDLNNLPKTIDESKLDVKENLSEKSEEIQNETLLQVSETSQVEDILDEEINKKGLENFKETSIKMINEDKCSPTKSTSNKLNLPATDCSKKCSLASPKHRKEQSDDGQFDSFQEAFVKTLKIENPSKVENNREAGELEVKNEATSVPNVTEEPVITNFSIIDNFDSIEVVVADNTEADVKSDEVVTFTNDKNNTQSETDSRINIENSNALVVAESPVVKCNENFQKLDELTSSVVSFPLTPSTTDVKVSVPVKKREKPRIIENVALKEPMILKTKLMEKHIGKTGKHKLENENIKSNESKCYPKSKVMKMETVISNSKSKSHVVVGNQNLSTSKKVIKTLTTEDSFIPPITDVKNEQVTTALSQEVPGNEKYIQQSSQSLVDMELDINSMPFVLSEDVLTPENIEQMPVVISSVIPTTNPITNTLATTLITPTKQITSANQSFESSKEISEVSPKKKSGTPTILKNKNKAKPTITSIKTIVPPLTSTAYKGGSYKVNTQALKTSLGNQKTSGKYVIVQTSGHQQAYSTHQKVAIPTSKGSGNAQIVQQGNKVVILTSSQSGQSGQKMLPFNILKAQHSGKVQRIITTKQGQQMLTTISPQNFVGTKTALTSKSGDLNSLNTSKVVGQKVLGQQVMTSKSVLTQLPGTIAKPTLLGTLPQSILTKEGIYTPINASTLGGKTIISSKALVAKSFAQQGIGTSKNVLTPLTQSLSGKTILSQGIVSKGTVLTPITGSQVKALAAKNIKGNKLQYQSVQRKVQLTGIQKSPKVPISSSPGRSSTNVKTTSSVVVLQNTELKSVAPKKCVKQTVQQQMTATALPSSGVITMQPKGTTVVTKFDKKIVSDKNVNRSVQLQQKIIAKKTEESTQFKPLSNDETLTLKRKVEQQKPVMKPNKNINKNVQKRISNVSNTSVSSPSNLSASFSITVPPSELTSFEKILKKEEIPEQTTPKEETIVSQHKDEADKMEESKVHAQTQIMALPTENSDGSQTYVLVTVDEQGHIIPLDNNALMSLDGTPNFDGSRTLYIDSSSLSESGSMDNIVLQIDNGSLTNLQSSTVPESTRTVVTETSPSSEITQTMNQDILAAALANTDFQHEIGVPETTGSTAMTSLTQTSLINQTILQSTIIPPTEPISSPLVLETSLTLNQPIMTPLEVPSNLSIKSELTPATSSTTIPTTLVLPISTANQNISYTSTEESSLQIPGNSMPEIEGTMETSSSEKTIDIKIPLSTQSSVKTNLVEEVTNAASEKENKSDSGLSYSISISENVFDKKQIQTTPSMPIIDDTFNGNSGFDSTNASVVVEDNLQNFVTKTSEELIRDLTGNDSLQENNEIFCSKVVTNNETSIQKVTLEASHILNDTQDDCVSSQQNISSITEHSEENIIEDSSKINKKTSTIDKINEEVCAVSAESSIKVQSSLEVQTFNDVDRAVEATAAESALIHEKETLLTSNEELSSAYQPEVPSTETKTVDNQERDEKILKSGMNQINVCQTSDATQDELNQVQNECNISFEDRISETSQEVPSQSYEQLVSATSDVAEVPSQSAKTENSREATQSVSYEAMETDDNALTGEPPTQSYNDSKENEASQSYKMLSEISTNAPTQSFHEIMEVNEERVSMDESMDDPNFPTQSYEVEKMENLVENMETDTEISQEGNIPSQSNDIGADGIGTSSVSTNNSALNEDETASSSYVPETPENQERDQDQESAISTSSYEIPPCEELNIASSSVIPDTSVQLEHTSIHDNGVPEIPTSSYNLNPDSSSTHVDAVPTSSYEDQIIVEQNVSTSFEVPISMANLKDRGSQNYVTDSSEERNEPTSYYSHHQEVTESYYESMCKQSNSQLESNSEEEATPSYYENNPADITSEASQSYFNQEEATPSYSNHDISPSYYDPRPEAEASQSYYSSHELNRSSQSALQNVEATQSFYQENSNEQRLGQQGEATPTYADRYSLDYVPVNSPLDRHDLVESSVPARSMDR